MHEMYVNGILTGKELPWLVCLPKVDGALQDPQVRSWRVRKFDEHISHMEELLEARNTDLTHLTHPAISYTVCNPSEPSKVHQSNVLGGKTDTSLQYPCFFVAVLHETIFFLHRISSVLLELAGCAVKIGFQSACQHNMQHYAMIPLRLLM